LDGFDLGAGALHLFLRKEQSRRIAMNAIGPIWDGNEVWLVIGGGSLFAGFPVAYAAIFSAFYVPFYVFLVGLIFRAVSIEFRSKEPWAWWRRSWDIVYCVASIIIALCLGLMLGNVVEGLPLDNNREFAGNLFSFFNPFAMMVSVTTLALFMMHGAIFLTMKTENRLFVKLHVLANNFIVFFVISFVITTFYTLLYIPHLSDFFKRRPEWFVVPLLMTFSIANIPRQVKVGKYRFAFLSSAVTIALLLIMVAMAVFPYLLYSPGSPANSITVYNAASSPRTLKILLIMALVGTPLVGIYTSFVFWTFKGKVRLDETSY
jgi:cytochrome bd ubiquinol oxidase subunit II